MRATAWYRSCCGLCAPHPIDLNHDSIDLNHDSIDLNHDCSIEMMILPLKFMSFLPGFHRERWRSRDCDWDGVTFSVLETDSCSDDGVRYERERATRCECNWYPLSCRGGKGDATACDQGMHCCIQNDDVCMINDDSWISNHGIWI